MKFGIFLFLLGLITVAWAWTEEHNGRPLCTDASQVGKTYRNNWDPTRYFVCKSFGAGVAGEYVRCEGQYMYQAHLGHCVKAEDWEWEENVDPPNGLAPM